MGKIVIAIDGPAAAGKGMVSAALTDIFPIAYLDTGKFYRALAVAVLAEGKACDDKDEVLKMLATLDKAAFARLIESPSLRAHETSDGSSKVSAIPEVRKVIASMQREFAYDPPPVRGKPALGSVLDGRDIGTVVAPDAAVKIFLTASLEARAMRRHADLVKAGSTLALSQVRDDIRSRDERDTTRATSPLRAAGDAVAIDTSAMKPDQVLKAVIEVIMRKAPELYAAKNS